MFLYLPNRSNPMDKIKDEETETETETENSIDTDKTVHATARDLVLSRIIDASPNKIFRAWTGPELIKQ
jgi:hypothetical protein